MRSKKLKMNVKLLRQVKQRILDRPEQVNMDNWFSARNGIMDLPSHCGTAACIGGWTVCLARDSSPARLRQQFLTTNIDIHTVAQRLLRLNDKQAARLFYAFEWPAELGHRLLLTAQIRTYAAVVAERIDLMIKEGK